jgi:hypothetical protein
MRIAKSALLYFLLAFAAGFALGAIRVPFLVPRLGERVAELIEAPVMLAVIVLAARFIVARPARGCGTGALLAVGMLALALLLAVEFTVVLKLRGLALGDYVATRDPVAGTVYAVLLLAFAAMPAVMARFNRS